jgi:hypothetical protein
MHTTLKENVLALAFLAHYDKIVKLREHLKICKNL